MASGHPSPNTDTWERLQRWSPSSAGGRRHGTAVSLPRACPPPPLAQPYAAEPAVAPLSSPLVTACPLPFTVSIFGEFLN